MGKHRDHYYTVRVFVPSDVDISDDRIRWYFDHAIRGYYQKFASQSDPIRGMARCSILTEKTPLAKAKEPNPPATEAGR